MREKKCVNLCWSPVQCSCVEASIQGRKLSFVTFRDFKSQSKIILSCLFSPVGEILLVPKQFYSPLCTGPQHATQKWFDLCKTNEVFSASCLRVHCLIISFFFDVWRNVTNNLQRKFEKLVNIHVLWAVLCFLQIYLYTLGFFRTKISFLQFFSVIRQ